jgi:hypothetical protein
MYAYDDDYDDDRFADEDDDEAYGDRDEDRDDDDFGDAPFANPGGNSALRAASRSNPRNLPCPTCGRPDMLTPADVARHYQCDGCADRAEGKGWDY